LQDAVDALLRQKAALEQECTQLKREKQLWQKEKELLLAEVEQALKRFDRLDLEGL
jgi:FtsZ-binding cell division protein ZapB